MITVDNMTLGLHSLSPPKQHLASYPISTANPMSVLEQMSHCIPRG